MFRALVNNENGFTIKVGSGETFAKERIENVQQVIALLESL
jgi:trehalose-6-phosphatase